MQVRVHRDHGVKQTGQEAADDALAHRFAGVERDVLPHVGQVWRHQREVHGAELVRGARDQQDFNQLLVRLVQAAPEHHTRWQALGQSQAQLAVRKAVALNDGQRQTRRSGNRLGDGLLIVKTQQAASRKVGGHQNSTNTWGTWSA
ncbi:hypothetical protein D9M68_858810 [compost metagenome]